MDENKELTVVKRQVTVATQKANELAVTDDKGYELADVLLSKIKKAQRLITTEKNKVLRPLLDATKAERERWAPVEQDGLQAEKIVKSKMQVYFTEKEEKQRIEEAKIQKKVEEGKMKIETAAKKMEIVQAPPVETKSKVRKVKVVKITNPSLVPMKYFVLDEVAVRKDALAGVKIPGVEVVEENQIAGY